MKFHLESPYRPSGDQPGAIKSLCNALNQGIGDVTLLGVTGSGKTFTMANVIEKLQRPALVLSHNKTLAAQLYGEFKRFFPANAVEYFVSYYDYYQPEAYLPTTDTYIEKDLSINDQIDKLRLSAASALMSGRRDVIVVSSVSCLYGIGNPEDFHAQSVTLKKGEQRSLTRLLYQLVDANYSRTEVDFKRGTFRVRGDTVDVFLGGADEALRIEFFGDEIDSLSMIDPVTGAHIEELQEAPIFPATNFVTTRERSIKAVSMIQDDLRKQLEYFEEVGKGLEAKRLRQRVENDLEMIKEMGYCPGIENYSRYLDGRQPGQRPFCLIDYFPDDFITFIDESHVTIPQIRAMYGGDHSRKSVLVEYGFRLPAAADNRPLTFDEFNAITGQKVYVSATPADYELERSAGLVVEQVVRPTGLLDPPIEVRPIENQVDDLVEEIRKRAEVDERVLVTTLTKRMAEELNDYLDKIGIRVRYIHSDVDTSERVEIIEDFKNGTVSGCPGSLHLIGHDLQHLRIIEHVRKRLHRRKADLVTLLLLLACTHLHRCRSHPQVVHRLEAVKQRDAGAHTITVVESGDRVVGIGLRIKVTAILVVGVGLRRKSRRESLHYCLTSLPLLVAAVRRLDSHLCGIAHGIFHAVMQSHS